MGPPLAGSLHLNVLALASSKTRTNDVRRVRSRHVVAFRLDRGDNGNRGSSQYDISATRDFREMHCAPRCEPVRQVRTAFIRGVSEAECVRFGPENENIHHSA